MVTLNSEPFVHLVSVQILLRIGARRFVVIPLEMSRFMANTHEIADGHTYKHFSCCSKILLVPRQYFQTGNPNLFEILPLPVKTVEYNKPLMAHNLKIMTPSWAPVIHDPVVTYQS